MTHTRLAAAISMAAFAAAGLGVGVGVAVAAHVVAAIPLKGQAVYNVLPREQYSFVTASVTQSQAVLVEVQVAFLMCM